MKIDIIIPAYKAQKTLWKTLLSITMQSYKDECLITVVNDDNIKNDDYNNIIDKFKTVLNVRLINTPYNLGAAQAREFGIKHTWLPYMMFLDSDDILSNQLSIFNLLTILEKNSNLDFVRGKCRVIRNNDIVCFTNENWGSTHGCLFKRSSWINSEIEWPIYRCNEDGVVLNLCIEKNMNYTFLNEFTVDIDNNGENHITKSINYDSDIGAIDSIRQNYWLYSKSPSIKTLNMFFGAVYDLNRNILKDNYYYEQYMYFSKLYIQKVANNLEKFYDADNLKYFEFFTYDKEYSPNKIKDLIDKILQSNISQEDLLNKIPELNKQSNIKWGGVPFDFYTKEKYK